MMKASRALPMLVAASVMQYASGCAALAQEYPTRAVILVVPFAAGGGADTVARILAPRLSTSLGKPVIVENRPGAGTVLAASAVAKAAPDGQTLLIAASGTMAINPTLYKQLSYRADKDFAPVALTVSIPLVLVIDPSLPIYSVADLIAAAKERPDRFAFGSSGVGSSLHLAAEMLKSAAGISMTHVPYRGGAQALADVIAGHLPLMFNEPSSSLPQIRAGKVRPLGVSSALRVPSLPDVPTLAESGLPGFEAVSWQMIVAPAGTPRAIIEKLHATVNAIMATPEIREQIAQIGMIPLSSPPPTELEGFVLSELAIWGKVVREAGIAGSE